MSRTSHCQAANPATCTSPRCPQRQAFALDFVSQSHRAAPRQGDKPGRGVQLAAARVLRKHAHEIVFANSGDGSYGADLTLADMADPNKARGNCWRAANAFLRNDNPFFGRYRMYVIELEGMPGYHAATLVLTDAGQYVVDYTIRQFDATLPFPYVGTQAAWVDTIERATGASAWYGATDDEADDEGDMDGWEPVTRHSAVRVGG